MGFLAFSCAKSVQKIRYAQGGRKIKKQKVEEESQDDQGRRIPKFEDILAEMTNLNNYAPIDPEMIPLIDLVF